MTAPAAEPSGAAVPSVGEPRTGAPPAVVPRAAAPPAAVPRAAAPPAADARRLTRTERTVAARMADARREVPDFAVTVEVRADALRARRAALRAQGADPLPSFNDFVVKACALALRAHPRLNASYRDGQLVQHRQVDVGVAVAGEDTLLVPVVRDADRRPLAQLAADTRALAAAARARTLAPAQMDGGTFTVSNLGMLGVRRFTAIVNQPQAAILAVGEVRDGLAREQGAIVDRATCELTLTCDHRIVYGAHAAAFLADVRALLEAPARLDAAADG